MIDALMNAEIVRRLDALQANEIRLTGERRDLALLVCRLMRRVEAARSGKGTKAGDDKMLAEAKNYLRRKGLDLRVVARRPGNVDPTANREA